VTRQITEVQLVSPTAAKYEVGIGWVVEIHLGQLEFGQLTCLVSKHKLGCPEGTKVIAIPWHNIASYSYTEKEKQDGKDE
jgi:hypothetical protein